MLKKFTCFLLLFIFLISFVSSAVDVSGIGDNADDLKEKIDTAKEFTEEDKWEYLSEGWREVFLKNKVVASLDVFFTKINIVFIVLFGQDYELSLTLLFTVILWGCFFYTMYIILKDFSAFSGLVSAVISLGLNVVLSQIGLFRWFGGLIFKFIFYKEGIWGWIMFLLFVIVMIIIVRLISILGKAFIKERTLMKKERMEYESGVLHRFFKTLTRAVRKK